MGAIRGEPETTLAAADGLALAADELASTFLGPAGVATVTVFLVVASLGALETALAAGDVLALAADELAATFLGPAGVATVTCLLLLLVPPTFLLLDGVALVGAVAFGAAETALAAGDGVALAADELAETFLLPAGVATDTVLFLLSL